MVASHWFILIMCQHMNGPLGCMVCLITFSVSIQYSMSPVPSCATCYPYSGDVCHPVDVIL
jgi:hypothetical protein